MSLVLLTQALSPLQECLPICPELFWQAFSPLQEGVSNNLRMPPHFSLQKSYGLLAVVVHRTKAEGCHSEPEHSGGEESHSTQDSTRDSSACGLRMTDHQNQCARLVAGSLVLAPGALREDELRPYVPYQRPYTHCAYSSFQLHASSSVGAILVIAQ